MAPSGSIESRLAGWAKQGVRRHFVAQASHESFHRKGFLERLSLAEARDMAGSAAMQRSALALDELMFDGDSDEDEEDGSDPLPLEPKSAKGRCVLIPHSMWPDYECTENGGAGWSVVIKACDRSGIAKVRFDNATDGAGRPYPDEHARLSNLRPLS